MAERCGARHRFECFAHLGHRSRPVGIRGKIGLNRNDYVLKIVFGLAPPQGINRPVPRDHCQPCRHVAAASVEGSGIAPQLHEDVLQARPRPPRCPATRATRPNTQSTNSDHRAPPWRPDRPTGSPSPAPGPRSPRWCQYSAPRTVPPKVRLRMSFRLSCPPRRAGGPMKIAVWQEEASDGRKPQSRYLVDFAPGPRASSTLQSPAAAPCLVRGWRTSAR